MTKQEANDIFDSKGEDALDKLLDYILVEQNYNKATKFIMETVGATNHSKSNGIRNNPH